MPEYVAAGVAVDPPASIQVCYDQCQSVVIVLCSILFGRPCDHYQAVERQDRMCACVYVCLCVCMRVCVLVCVCLCVCLCARVCMHVHLSLSVYMCIASYNVKVSLVNEHESSNVAFSIRIMFS